jgi:hypothetical protein
MTGMMDAYFAELDAARAEVRSVIQRVYGDATQTVLDHRAAEAIVSALLAAYWIPPTALAGVVLGAGGQAAMDLRPLDGGYELLTWREPLTDAPRFKVRQTSTEESHD